MTSEGIAEGYLSECEDRVRTLEWQLSEATKAVEQLRLERDGVLGGQVEQLQASVAYVNELRASNERLRSVERAARSAVETERTLGYVKLTLLADALEELDRHKGP